MYLNPPIHRFFRLESTNAMPRHKRADRRVHKARLKKQAVSRINMFYPMAPTAVAIGAYVSTHGCAWPNYAEAYSRKAGNKPNLVVPPMPPIETLAQIEHDHLLEQRELERQAEWERQELAWQAEWLDACKYEDDNDRDWDFGNRWSDYNDKPVPEYSRYLGYEDPDDREIEDHLAEDADYAEIAMVNVAYGKMTKNIITPGEFYAY